MTYFDEYAAQTIVDHSLKSARAAGNSSAPMPNFEGWLEGRLYAIRFVTPYGSDLRMEADAALRELKFLTGPYRNRHFGRKS